MPRDLADVLHYFMPELESESDSAETPLPTAAPPRFPTPSSPESRLASERNRSVRAAPRRHVALPLAAVPVGDQDVVRATMTWSLAVEVARLGGRAILLLPRNGSPNRLFPGEGVEPLGAEIRFSAAQTIGELHLAALDLAVEQAADAEQGGVIFVLIPPAWLREPPDAGSLMRWLLIFTSAAESDLAQAYDLARRVLQSHPSAQVGVTVHGARGQEEARDAFGRLNRSTEKDLGLALTDYGGVVDDLDIYRSIVAQRAIGIAHPDSAAAEAIRDVARRVYDSARENAYSQPHP